MHEGLAVWEKITGQVRRCLCGSLGDFLNKHEQMLREELGEWAGESCGQRWG